MCTLYKNVDASGWIYSNATAQLFSIVKFQIYIFAYKDERNNYKDYY